MSENVKEYHDKNITFVKTSWGGVVSKPSPLYAEDKAKFSQGELL